MVNSPRIFPETINKIIAQNNNSIPINNKKHKTLKSLFFFSKNETLPEKKRGEWMKIDENKAEEVEKKEKEEMGNICN